MKGGRLRRGAALVRPGAARGDPGDAEAAAAAAELLLLNAAFEAAALCAQAPRMRRRHSPTVQHFRG